MIPLALIMKHQRVFSKLFLLMFLALGGAKAQEKAQQQSFPLRVLTYNIHIGNPPAKPGVTDLESIARVINESEADLIALQEVDVFTNRSGKDRDQAKELAALTKRHVYFVKAIDHDGGEYGVAILSKFPFVNKEHYFLPTAEDAKRSEQRVLAVVTVEVADGILLDFASTHFDLTPETRFLQAEYVVAIAKQRSRPFVLGGDLNTEPGSSELNKLDEYFVRSRAFEGNTFPAGNPVSEIDYILFTPKEAFQVEKHQVIQEHEASDHLPVYVELKCFP